MGPEGPPPWSNFNSGLWKWECPNGNGRVLPIISSGPSCALFPTFFPHHSSLTVWTHYERWSRNTSIQRLPCVQLILLISNRLLPLWFCYQSPWNNLTLKSNISIFWSPLGVQLRLQPQDFIKKSTLKTCRSKIWAKKKKKWKADLKNQGTKD